MPLWLIVLVIVVGAVVWTFRRRIFRGRRLRAFKSSDFADGHFPPEFHQLNHDMQHKVGDAATRYYAQTPPKDTPPDLLPFFGQTYSYAVALDVLCHEVRFVDSFPPEPGRRGSAAANITKDATGHITMGLTPRAKPEDVEHELAHSLSWISPELWEQCKRSPRNHWPVMFDVIGPYA